MRTLQSKFAKNMLFLLVLASSCMVPNQKLYNKPVTTGSIATISSVFVLVLQDVERSLSYAHDKLLISSTAS
ncbi:hypothetical protein PR001_g4791 [Phytophthora rubi]|uniref:RxLR effector protein n=1 Tax=Phytophthora rubi TaxID=129364 RepID=A0A6A3NFG4_9STRA|nr:hypothetical protein PR002_g5173 [Phytophthora rubi]KAE9045883.1 hypothetical protein PR001_g4791 [Phytophthora rubi]